MARENQGAEFVKLRIAPASFKSDVWKYFGFPVSRNDREEKKVTDGLKKKRHCTDTAGL